MRIVPFLVYPRSEKPPMATWLRSISWLKFGLWIGILLIAMVSGVFVAAENYIPIALLIGLLLGWALFKWPDFWLTVTIIGILVIPGLVELYLPQLMLIRWLFPIMAVASSVAILLSRLFGRRPSIFGRNGKRCIILVFLFVIISIFSSLLNNGFTANALVGLKGYFQIWPILLGLFYTDVKMEKLANIFSKSLVWVGLLQIPIALHQFFVLVPMRMTTRLAEEGVVAIDVVAGSFGAMMWGGGRSTVLGIFQMIAITLVTMQYRRNLISLRRFIVLTSLLLIPVLVSEIKAFPFFLLVSCAVVFRDVLVKHPFKFASYAFLLAGVCSILFIGNFFLPATKGQQATSLDKYIDNALSYNIGDKGYGNAVLNRSSVYSFWAKENIDKQDVMHLFIGYGAGTTNAFTSIETDSLAESLYPGYDIGLTTFSALLWESGVLGALIIAGVIYYAFRAALSSARSTFHLVSIMSITLAVSLLLVCLTSFHVNYFIFDLGYQTLFIVALGLAVLLENKNADL